MVALASYRCFTRTHTQALVFQKLDALFRSTRLVISGLEWTAPTLDLIAQQIGVHKATVSRAIQWLKEQGFIMVRSSRWARSPRLYVRVLTHFHENTPPVQRERNVSRCIPQPVTLHPATSCIREDKSIRNNPDTGTASACSGVSVGSISVKISGEDDPATPDPLPPAPSPRKLLRGSVGQAKARLSDRQPDTPPKGTLHLAQRWSAALVAHGHAGFTADNKTLAHIKNVVARFAAAGLDFEDHLAAVIYDWPDFAPIRAGKVPLPWAVIRASDNYFKLVESRAAYSAAQTAQEPPVPATPPTPAPLPQPASSTPPVAAPAPSKGGLMHKWSWATGKDSGQAATPPSNPQILPTPTGPTVVSQDSKPAKQLTIAELLKAGINKVKAGKE